MCKRLQQKDTYYAFDFDYIVEDLLYDLKRVPGICCNLVGKGNSSRYYDSYGWSLSELLFEMRNNNENGMFDIVYLDGSHSFIHDGLTCCLLKELIKPEGYLVFDDVFWTYEKSPSSNPNVNPKMKELFTDEQLCDCQVQRVLNAFMITDKRFKEICMSSSLNPERAVYRKCNIATDQ